MKILIASDTYYPTVNGAAYFTFRLSTELAKKGHKVFVISPSKSLDNTVDIIEGVKVYGVRSIPVMFYDKFRVSPIFMIDKTVKSIVSRISPDVIHIQNHFNIGRAVVSAGESMGIPIVGTNHFMPENLIHYLHLPKATEKKIMQIAWRDFSKVYGKLDVVTSPTITAANLLKDVGFSKEVLPISCGIDLKRFNPKNNGKYLFKKYGIPSNLPRLLYVGRLDKDKNVDTIINALPKILKHKKAHLVIGGVGKLRKELENLVTKLGVSKSVTFLGFVSDKDLPKLYSIANVFITTGGAELQCLSALEATATGIPVVAANAVAVPELVQNGKNGFLFPLNNSTKLARGVVNIIKDKRIEKRMGSESLKIAKRHDIRKTISSFEEVYRKSIYDKGIKKNSDIQNLSYFSGGFIFKTLFVIIILLYILEVGLFSPPLTLAEGGTVFKNKIMNSQIVKKIEDFDNRIKTSVPIKLYNSD